MFKSTFIFEDGFIKRLFEGETRYEWMFRSDAVAHLNHNRLLSDAERESLSQAIAEYDQSEQKAA